MSAETVELKFDQEAVNKAEEEYKRLHLDPAQQDMIDSLTKIMNELVPIPETAVKGLIWKVVNNWQKMRRITIAELSNRPLRDRIEVSKEIIKQAKKFYINLLSEATSEQKEMLERKFDTVLRKSSEFFRN